LKRAVEFILVLVLVGVAVAVLQTKTDEPTPGLSWPPDLKGEALEVSVSIKGVKPTDFLLQRDTEEQLGKPLHYSFSYFGGEVYAYEGPVIVEEFGSNGHVDCVYAPELNIGDKTITLNTSRADFVDLLGPAHAVFNNLLIYRIQGNYRLLICFDPDGKARYFALFNGLGGRQKYGWPKEKAGPWIGEDFPNPFELQRTD
jgi:hypothetical protein